MDRERGEERVREKGGEIERESERWREIGEEIEG